MKLFRGKKAQGLGVRRPVSFLLGLIFLAFGLIPLLNAFGVIRFEIPFNTVGLILWILATVGGIFLLWNVLNQRMSMGVASHLRIASLVGALIILAIGIIPILFQFGLIPFNLPDFVSIIHNVLFTVVGVLLLYGAARQF